MRVPFGRWPVSGPVRRALFFVMIEGGVVAGMLVAMEVWMVPLLQTRLGAAAFVIGVLSLLPQLGMIGLSPFTREAIQWLGGAKRATILTSWLQVACMAALSVPIHAAGSVWAVPLAVALICAFGLSGAINGPAWVAWAAGFVPRGVSGRYQARRMVVFNLAKLACAALFAGVAFLLPLEHGPWGLQIIILAGVLSRLGSIWCLQRQPDLRPRARPQPLSRRSAEAATGMLGFVRTMPRTDIGRWTLVWASFIGGAMVAGPFFGSYMIAAPAAGGMGLDPFTYSLLIYTSVLARILFYPVVGRMVDLFGPRAVLRVAFSIILVLPLAWALTTNLAILLLNEVVAGAAWAAAEISIGALLFAAHPDPERRAELIGYFNAVCAAIAAAGTLLGTVLIDLVPPLLGSHYHTIFLLSMALRLPGLILAVRWLPALRPIKPDEERYLIDALPGVELASAFGRGLVGLLRRPFD